MSASSNIGVMNHVSGAGRMGQAWLYKAGGAAAFVQLICVLLTFVVLTALGGEPATVNEYFTVLQNDRITGLLRLDFFSFINVTLFTVTAFALYAALRRQGEMGAVFATGLVLIGVAVAAAKHSSFSMIHLSDQYAAATTEAQRSMLLAAGEAVMASDWWHSMGGWMAGIFLQGGMVIMSFVMLRSKKFGKITAYAGILSNGLDWIHIPVGLFFPELSYIILSIGGLFYFVWFPLLGRDLYRLGREVSKEAFEEK